MEKRLQKYKQIVEDKMTLERRRRIRKENNLSKFNNLGRRLTDKPDGGDSSDGTEGDEELIKRGRKLEYRKQPNEKETNFRDKYIWIKGLIIASLR